MSATPSLRQFLGLLNEQIRSNNGEGVWNLLPIEPPFNPDYHRLLNEVFARFKDEDSLKEAIRSGIDVVAQDDKDAWKCSGALQNDPYGILILPATLQYAKVLARIAIGLDKQPDLVAHLQVADEGQNASLPEQAAMTLRSILGICARDSKPNGKGTAVYKFANICMQILFQCNKPESVPHVYNVVGIQKRPIDSYPRAERVTYLYYLGRFFFVTSQFHAAVRTLDAAYIECHTQALKQRRLILVYLISASIILGRFPAHALFDRPEAVGFQDRFQPICKAIKQGDIATFRNSTALESPHADWFLYFGLLYQLRYRCETLVWRSLARRTFAIRNMGAEIGGATSEGKTKAPTLDLEDLLATARPLFARTHIPLLQADAGGPGNRHTNYIFISTDSPQQTAYIDPDLEGGYDNASADLRLPDLDEVEGQIASLTCMGLMNGYISHQLGKFAIQGARNKPATQAGWPSVWEVLNAQHKDDDIPGWKRVEGAGGMVIQLQGAAAAGS